MSGNAGTDTDSQGGREVHPVLRLAAWAGLVYVGLAQLWLRLDGYVPRDLAMYARAGRWWADDQSPYTQAFRVAGEDTLPFVYQPGTLPLFEPLGWLPSWAMPWVSGGWFVIGVAALVGPALYFRRRFAPETPGLVAVGVVVVLFPAYFALTYGNIGVLLPLAAVGLHRLASGSAGWEAPVVGICLGLAAGMKPYWLLSFAAVLVARRRWKEMGWMTAGFVVAAAGTLVWWRHASGWLQQLQLVDRLYWTVVTGPLTTVIDVGLVAIWAGLFGWWVHRERPGVDAVFVVALSSVAVWPRVAPYSYLMVLPAIFFVAGQRNWKIAGVALFLGSAPVVWVVIQLGVPALPRLYLYGWAAGVMGVALAHVAQS